MRPSRVTRSPGIVAAGIENSASTVGELPNSQSRRMAGEKESWVKREESGYGSWNFRRATSRWTETKSLFVRDVTGCLCDDNDETDNTGDDEEMDMDMDIEMGCADDGRAIVRPEDTTSRQATTAPSSTTSVAVATTKADKETHLAIGGYRGKAVPASG
ncbi:hypothetical protein C8R45DRAFT_930588 [Mycena sanguinolenta]|nr:hypothetical protein C8R45DRAFT_930588 [Mycena sanguinolenta]